MITMMNKRNGPCCFHMSLRCHLVYRITILIILNVMGILARSRLQVERYLLAVKKKKDLAKTIF